MNSIARLLRLPEPTDLVDWDTGLWDPALGLGVLPQPGRRTRDEYEQHLATLYPVRAWLAFKFADFIYYRVWMRFIERPIKTLSYWLISHVVPSRRYHMLDLRQPNGYRYGWSDIDTRLECAMFNLLNLFVEKEKSWLPTEEDVAKDSNELLQAQRDKLLEIQAIYHWWNVERVAQEKAIDDYGGDLCPSNEEVKSLSQMEAEFYAKKTEMIIRLVKAFFKPSSIYTADEVLQLIASIHSINQRNWIATKTTYGVPLLFDTEQLSDANYMRKWLPHLRSWNEDDRHRYSGNWWLLHD